MARPDGWRWRPLAQQEQWDYVNHPVNGYTPLTMSSFWLIDLMASYRINKNLTASINLNNAFDKKYYTMMTLYDVYSWGEPRSVNGSLRYDF